MVKFIKANLIDILNFTSTGATQKSEKSKEAVRLGSLCTVLTKGDKL